MLKFYRPAETAAFGKRTLIGSYSTRLGWVKNAPKMLKIIMGKTSSLY